MRNIADVDDAMKFQPNSMWVTVHNDIHKRKKSKQNLGKERCEPGTVYGMHVYTEL